MNLSNNTILITGGSSGIGFEFAKQLLARGNKVIVTGRDEPRLQKAKQLLPDVDVICSDASQPREIEALLARIKHDFPSTNVLINNAGIARNIDLQDSAQDLTALTNEVEINLNGPIRMCNVFVPWLKTKPAAAIINVTSGLAFVPQPISPMYCASKAGLHSFTLSLRVHLSRTPIKVFEIAPPVTQTELLKRHDDAYMKGLTTIMSASDMVAASIKGIEQDRYEILPGQSTQLKLMSRLAPSFALKILSKPVQRLLDAKH